MEHSGDSSSFVEEPASPDARTKELERQVLALQYKLNTEQNDAELLKLSLEKEAANYNVKYKQCMRDLDKALSDTKYLYEQNSILEKKLAEERSKDQDKDAIKKMQQEIGTLKYELAMKEQELQTLSSDRTSLSTLYENKIQNLNLELQGNKSLLSKYEMEIERQAAQLRTLTQESAEKEDEIAVLKAAKVVMAHHNYSTEELQELTILNKTLQEQSALSKELEKANLEQANELKRLRQRNDSFKFLKHENSKLQLKLEQMAVMEQNIEDLQLENVQLQEKLANWELYSTEDTSPQDIIRELQLLKKERLGLADEVSKLQIDLNNIRILNDELALERNQLLDLNKKYETSILNLKKLNYEIEQQKLLSFEECKLLRRQLDELTEIDPEQSHDGQKDIQLLVSNYKSQTEDLTNELRKLNEEILKQNEDDEHHARKKRKMSDDLALNYSQRLNELHLKNKELERKLAASVENVNLLENKISKLQSLNEKKIRILQLRNNPLLKDQFIKRKQLKLLQEENNVLLSEKRGQKGVEVIPRAVYERLQFDIQQLEGELFSINKRTTRLKEMFNRKSLEFIDAVNSLLGFKLEFQVGGKVKMIPCYKPDKYLIADLQTNTLKSNLDKIIPDWDSMLKEYVDSKHQLPSFLAKIMLLLAGLSEK